MPKITDLQAIVWERERRDARGRWGLSLLNWTIGYGLGYRYFLVLFSVAGFVLIGAVVLRLSGEGPRNRIPWVLPFSLDNVLPILKLREYHYDVTLEVWPAVISMLTRSWATCWPRF